METDKPPGSAVRKLETQKNQWCSSSLGPNAWEPGELIVQIPIQGQEDTKIPAQQSGGKFPSYSAFMFYSGLRLDEAHQHQGSQSALVSLPIQIFTSPEACS